MENKIENKTENKKSVFHIEDLKFGSVCGVLEVESFTPAEVLLKISSGNIKIKGDKLEVKSFNVATGELTFEGEITSISLGQEKISLLQRLTK